MDTQIVNTALKLRLKMITALIKKKIRIKINAQKAIERRCTFFYTLSVGKRKIIRKVTNKNWLSYDYVTEL